METNLTFVNRMMSVEGLGISIMFSFSVVFFAISCGSTLLNLKASSASDRVGGASIDIEIELNTNVKNTMKTH